jgi:enoyl-CoA hydratase/carnithine racemase
LTDAVTRARAVVEELLCLLPGLPLDEALAAEALAGDLLRPLWPGARTGGAPGRVDCAQGVGGVTLTLDRPAAGNCLDRPMLADLAEGLEAARIADVPVVIAALGEDFCLGADVNVPTGVLRLYAALADRVALRIAGGCANAGLGLLAAGRVVAHPGAWFAAPAMAAGRLPGAGACGALLRRIGADRARRVLIAGERISATQALDWGLIDALVQD